MTTTSKLPDPKKARAYFSAKMSFSLGPYELSKMMKEGRKLNLIDVRDSSHYKGGHIPGAVNVPREDWEQTKALKKTMLNILYCSSLVCHLAPEAAMRFAAKGYPVMELDGGFEEWRDHGMDVDVTAELPAAEVAQAALPLL